MVKLINDLANSLNVGKNMSGQQVIDASQILYDEFSHLKLNDVVFCFNKIKRGHYGIIYDRLDVHVIMEKMHRFEADQTEQIEYHRQRENNAIKRETKALPLVKDVKHFIIKDKNVTIPKNIGPYMRGNNLKDNSVYWIKKIRADLNKKTELKPKKIIPTSDKEIQGWLKQFTTKTMDCPGSVRFIKRNGKMMDVTAFLNHKMYQKGLLNQRICSK